jgi:SAM-dependent methyltransferase
MSAPRGAPVPPEHLEEVPCPLCGRESREPAFAAVDRIFLTGPFAYVTCAACGLVYQNPRVRKERIAEHYPARSYTWTENRGEPRLLRRLVNRLEKRYLLHLYRREQAFVTRALRRAGVSARSIVDLGCGAGDRLALYREAGLRTLGVEMTEDAAWAELLGLPVVRSSVEEFLAAGPGPFDLVSAYHVLEHFHDPVAVLRGIRAALAPGGALVLEVPNIDSLEFRLFRERCYFIEAPRHLVFFTPRTLRLALEKAGFTLARHHTRKPLLAPYPIVLDLLPALDNRVARLRELDGGRYAFAGRLALALGIAALAPASLLEGLLGRGSSITALALARE